MSTGVSVCQWQTGFGHLLSRSRCKGVSHCIADIETHEAPRTSHEMIFLRIRIKSESRGRAYESGVDFPNPYPLHVLPLP